ncbi:MAG: hypothetical protein K2X77_16925 [Candidatus Obscuribacterales bacterium]|jgi:hypothetical protein|nr:hypothetical protein [Candidatus Obscuribacterales bacterium]
MNPQQGHGSQPIRELEWLADYFQSHGREDKALEILEELRRIRMKAQESLNLSEASDVRGFHIRAASNQNMDGLKEQDA